MGKSHTSVVFFGDTTLPVRVCIPYYNKSGPLDLFIRRGDYIFAYRPNVGLLRWNFIRDEVDFLPSPFRLTHLGSCWIELYPVPGFPTRVVVVHRGLIRLYTQSLVRDATGFFFVTYDFSTKKVVGYFYRIFSFVPENYIEDTVIEPFLLSNEDFSKLFPSHDYSLECFGTFTEEDVDIGYCHGNLFVQYLGRCSDSFSSEYVLLSFEYAPFLNIIQNSNLNYGTDDYLGGLARLVIDGIFIAGDSIILDGRRFSFNIPEDFPFHSCKLWYYTLGYYLENSNAIFLTMRSRSAFCGIYPELDIYLNVSALKKYQEDALRYAEIVSVYPTLSFEEVPELENYYNPRPFVYAFGPTSCACFDALFERVGIFRI
ncbi:MAG: hypothetical protein KatS3mg087_0152 [Patescibacteria group bacterium]|nr:MAG: hypothetical protein KatS3mg087_0152 [Patescibacteria group bacterium]